MNTFQKNEGAARYSEVTQEAVEEKLPEFTGGLLLTSCSKLARFLPVNRYTSETASCLGKAPASYGLTRIILNSCTAAVSSLFKKQVKQHRLLFRPTNEPYHSLPGGPLSAGEGAHVAARDTSTSWPMLPLPQPQLGRSRKKTRLTFR